MNKGIANLLLLLLFIACQKSSVEDVTNTENSSTFEIGTVEILKHQMQHGLILKIKLK